MLILAVVAFGCEPEQHEHFQAARERPHPCGGACRGEITEISTGMVQTCIRYEAGGLVCWGAVRGVAEDLEQHPDWTSYSGWFPPAVMAEGMDSVVSVGAGQHHTCAALVDGSLWCWGDNEIGQLGHGGEWGRHVGRSQVPARVVHSDRTPVTDVVRVCSDSRTFAITRDGQMFSTAGGVRGEERLSRATETWGEAYVDCDDGASTHWCALKGDGTLYCAGSGYNFRGELGVESRRTNVGIPEGVQDAVDVAVGFGFSCAVRVSGKVACWGSNIWGALGRGSRSEERLWKPEDVVGLDDAAAIGAGFDSVCAIRRGGQLSCWGLDPFGLLGTRDPRGFGFSPVPVDIPSVPDAVDVDMSANHICVARRGGVVGCAGQNRSGQTNPNPRPVPYGELQILENLPP